MPIGAKLQALFIEKNTNVNEVASRTGISPNTIYSLIRRDSEKANIDDLYRVAHHLGVSLNYFVDGKESAEKTPANTEAIHIDNTMKKYAQLDDFGKRAVAAVTDIEYERCRTPRAVRAATAPGSTRVIPCSNLAASAGLGEWLDSENMDELEIPAVPGNRSADFAVPVSGDSMMPTYRDGDVLLIHEQDAVNVGDIGLFAINGNGFVKEMGDGELISHNREYENIPINESFRCFGKVIGKL